jgi:hypothetical protein
VARTHSEIDAPGPPSPPAARSAERAGAPLGTRRGAARTKPSRGRAVPGSAALPHAPVLAAVVSTPVRVDPDTCVGGRVGFTTDPRRRPGGRPRPGGTPVRGRDRRGREPRNRLGSRSRPRPSQEPRGMTRPGATGRHPHRSCPVSADHKAARTRCLGRSRRGLPGRAGDRGSAPPPVARNPAATGSSTTGVPPRRGRPSTQPARSVVNPTGPPTQVSGSRRTGLVTTAAWTGGRAPGGPSRERRAHRSPTRPDRPDATGMIRTSGRPLLWSQPWTPDTADHGRHDRK